MLTTVLWIVAGVVGCAALAVGGMVWIQWLDFKYHCEVSEEAAIQQSSAEFSRALAAILKERNSRWWRRWRILRWMW